MVVDSYVGKVNIWIRLMVYQTTSTTYNQQAGTCRKKVALQISHPVADSDPAAAAIPFASKVELPATAAVSLLELKPFLSSTCVCGASTVTPESCAAGKLTMHWMGWVVVKAALV